MTDEEQILLDAQVMSLKHALGAADSTEAGQDSLKNEVEVEESSSDDLGPDFGEDLDRDPHYDDRLEWMKMRIRSALSSVGEEKLYHFFKDEDAMYPCREFIDHEHSRIVFIYAGEDEKYTSSTAAPKHMQNKGVYFSKISPVPLRMDNIWDIVLLNDLEATKPLEQLLHIAQEVYFPLLSDSKNQEGWPEVIAAEVTDNMYRFLANTHITAGKVGGNTILPLPPKDLDRTDGDKDNAHILENAVVTWSKQIKNILKLEPEQMLKGSLHPGPDMEVTFWTNKANNLNSIHEQLNGAKIRKIMEVLEATKSTYYPAFDRLCKEVAVARDEANDTLLYLKPANRYFQLLLTDFQSVKERFRSIMHITLLVWKTSRFYNTPSRLVVLIREMCNDLIRQSCKYMDEAETEWHIEPKDSVAKLKLIIGNSLDFKETYYLYRNKSNEVCPEIPWNFQSSALFGRLDSFLERSHDVLDIMQTLTQFKTLEHIEIGGTKGKTLTSSVRQIFSDFQQSVLVFKEAQYNLMNIDVKRFDDHFHTFRTEVSELERRLASVIIQAFDDSTTILGSFKLLDSFETLLEREILHLELEGKQSDLLKEYLQDMGQVQEIFSEGKLNPPISYNDPPHSGAVAWVRGLLQRVQAPMIRLRQMSKIVLESDEGREVEKTFDGIVKGLQEYERINVERWAKNVSNMSEAKLKLPLLRRESGDVPLLHVNFDPELVCLLREVKCFLALGIDVPEAARTLYQNEEVFRVQTGNLDLIVNLYNQVLQTLLDVEKPLVQQKMDNIDKVLTRGLVHMNWKSHTISDFISQCTTIVKEVHGIVQTIKNNVAKTEKLLEEWSDNLLLERKLSRTYTPEELMLQQKELRDQRYGEIINGSEQIHSLLAMSQKALFAKRGSSHFKAYIDYVNHIVIDGLAKAVLANCRYLLLQVDPEYLAKNDINPLLEVQLKLEGGYVVFSPELGRTSTGAAVGDLVFEWINSFCNIGMLMRRIDTPTPDGNYLADIQENRELKYSIAVISSILNDNAMATEDYRQSFEGYSYLWLDDISQSFDRFLFEETENGEVMPPVDAFEEQIHAYRVLEEEIRELPGTKVIGWLKIDVRPLRNALLTFVSKWKDLYQEYPLNHVTAQVQELVSFIAEADKGISIDVIDNQSLVIVLTNLLAIRKREKKTDICFDPLKAIVHMLGKQEVPLPPELAREVQAVQDSWFALKQKAIIVKDRHGVITAKEAALLKERCKEFEENLQTFREYFLQTMPFNFSDSLDKAYDTIDELHHGLSNEHGTVLNMMAEMHDINRLQACFELDIVDYGILRICLQESILLKVAWDAVSLVHGTYAKWRTIRWTDVNIKHLYEENGSLSEFVRQLDPAIQEWNCYEGLSRLILDTEKTLPLLAALCHPSMQTQHWKQLMKATGVKFETDERFCLGSLLALNLHTYEEDVREIVERAKKEQVLEKQLADIDKVWGTLNMNFELYFDDPTAHVILVDDALLDQLQQHIVLLQQMFGSKYVQTNHYFLDRVLSWQEKLGMVESTLTVWTEVQTKWCNLRSIYLDSADIKEKLPGETKSFMELNLDWKSLMKESTNDPNVIRACNAEGRLQRLEGMLSGFQRCENALTDYLESRRMQFPRFYFLSDDALLDVLSKGKYPRMIAKHLKSCLDGVVALKFEDGDEGDGKTALGVMSPEDEYLAFWAPFECAGYVEDWMRGLAQHMQKTIESTITTSTPEFANMEKKAFLFSHCAQIVCVILRIHFCQQVNDVLDQVDRGSANAVGDFGSKIKTGLESIMELAATDLRIDERIMLTTVITLEMHQRDLVGRFEADRVENKEAFAWFSQLRYELQEGTNECTVQICDYSRYYGNEYIGNCGCLVITTLTERVNITLTQAVRLHLGGSLTGPAGTGKTETTKDLARNFGLIYYIFNCSDQITSENICHIFKGLAQLGAWACLDEFNRIEMPVMSVASSQLKAVIDAQRAEKSEFFLQGSFIRVNPDLKCTVFITMHHDYDHSSQIPESLRALFRPCSMVKPETEYIVEVLLTSQGFSKGRLLARKCSVLYRLSDGLLSKQDFYDWELRSMKTAILVAGENRRHRLDLEEEEVLLAVLRDFNMARLASDDVATFLNLVKSVLPSSMRECSHDHVPDFREQMLMACKDQSLQAHETFILKGLQLRSILSIRWAAYVLGPARCGKTTMLRMLAAAQNLAGDRTTCVCMNPKAVSRNELFGHLQESTKKWKDGIFTHAFRDFVVHKGVASCQILILDGDIDPEWIESLNTVMDENKILTLASGERLPLTPTMRLVFESADMKFASPGTVSRGGVVYMHESHAGWTSYAQTWVARSLFDTERSILEQCFRKYVPPCVEFLQKNSRAIVALPHTTLVTSICHILEAVIGNGEELQHIVRSKGENEYRFALESLFVYATIWGMGGSLTNEKVIKYSTAFDRFWRDTFLSGPTFPEQGTIFEYFFDKSACKFVHWKEKHTQSSYVPNIPFRNIYVSSPEVCKVAYVLEVLIDAKCPVMLVGLAGTGKSAMVRDRMRTILQVQQENVASSLEINLDWFTDSKCLQQTMESGIEKRTGRVYGPRGSRQLIYFVDDLNMPQVDKYGTQQAIAFLLQHFTYKFWYDREKLVVNEVHDVQFVSCMNPAVGSFTVDPRLQSGFTVLAVQMPTEETMFHIYASIVSGHFSSFDAQVQKLVGEPLIFATVNIYRSVSDLFIATPAKPQYVFNMRDISSVVQGLCRAMRQYYGNPSTVIRLWVHECERVFCDRLVSHTDIGVFDKMLNDVTMKWCDEFGDMNKVLAKPIVYTTFCSVASDGQDQPYCGVSDFEKLTHVVEEHLGAYNGAHAQMNLILFDQAILSICKIARIIGTSSGHALLVGMGGTGKQSLARLTAFMCGFEILENSMTFSCEEKSKLKEVQMRTGKDGARIVQIITEKQITHEHMLVVINEFLCFGIVNDLYSIQEKMEICDALRPKVQEEGIIDTDENCWEFYIESIRKNFHLCLCFSPSSEKFRLSCRQFPALLNTTSFVFFHPWQHDALVTVADHALNDAEVNSVEERESIALHMAFVHETVSAISEEYLIEEGRFYCTTPKSFLDYAELLQTLLKQERARLELKRGRLQKGLVKLKSCTDDVASLQEKLVADMALVEEKSNAADIIMKDVEEQTRIADNERFAVSDDEERCAAINAECERLKQECEEDFKKCEPILEQAEEALQTLDKKNLTELKALTSPPPGVEDVLIGVMILTSKGSIPKDLSWAAAKKVMANVDGFIKMLQTYDKESITSAAVAHCQKVLLTKDTFNPDRMRAKSSAASGMCSWVINICEFHRVFQTVLPKKRLLEEATLKLNESNEALSGVRARLKELDDQISALTSEYQAATREMSDAQSIANKTQHRLNMADRLINSLAEEELRWSNEVQSSETSEHLLLGSVLLSTAFISYIGAFNATYRSKLLFTNWVPDIQERRIPVLENFHPLDLLANEAKIAHWTREGLPSDSISQENAIIITTTQRWPLIIDPQLQAIRWLKKHGRRICVDSNVSNFDSIPTLEGVTTEEQTSPTVTSPTVTSPKRKEPEIKEVVTMRRNQATFKEQLREAITAGEVVIIENLSEKMDQEIETILFRATFTSANGKQKLINLGDKVIEYDDNFILYLQTQLPNPHFEPGVVAQATIVNFTITREALTEQLLLLVIKKERPDLYEQQVSLLESQSIMRVRLKELEDDLLESLSHAQGDTLSNEELVIGLEQTKHAAKSTEEQQSTLAASERDMLSALEVYRPIAQRSVLVYLVIASLWKLDDLYHFSLSQCVHYFSKGLDLKPDEDFDEKEEERFQYNLMRRKAAEMGGMGQGEVKDAEVDAETLKLQLRVESLRESACLSIFLGVSQALYPQHKLIFAAELCFRGLIERRSLDPRLLLYLVKGIQTTPTIESPFQDWLGASQWQAIVELSSFEMGDGEDAEGNPVQDRPFSGLPTDIHGSSRRFRDWYDLERPEEAPLPGEWRKIPEVNKLLVIQALRPDRLVHAISTFVRNEIGSKFLVARRIRLSKVYEDSSPQVPILFLLSPGVDPVKDVEALGEIHEIHYENRKLALVCLGQGQEAVAETTLNDMRVKGGWVFIQNLHLLKDWTMGFLQDRVEELSDAHESFRLFLSMEPSLAPITILKTSIKLTNEAPDGLQANILKALQPFQEEFFEMSTSPAELKAVVFGACVLHAVVIQRKKFGAIGWNQVYPFNLNDLDACSEISKRHIEVGDHRVPWNDLRYFFGDIIYGGHITDRWDRNLLNTYLDLFACEELLSGFEILPGMQAPTNWDVRIDELVGQVQRSTIKETPAAIGLHSNVEIAIMLDQGMQLCRSVHKMHAGGAQNASGSFVQERMGSTMNEVMEKLPTSMIVPDSALAKTTDVMPYVQLLQQEVVALNNLLNSVRHSLSEIQQVLQGELQISREIEETMDALVENKVPSAWLRISYPSLRMLGAWVSDLCKRATYLRDWCAEPNLSLPKVTWLPGLFAPKCFMTAVQLFASNRNGWAVDQSIVQAEVTKKTPEEIGASARDGAYIFGLFLEGATWDSRTSNLENAKSKALVCEMPVILVKAALTSGTEKEEDNVYECPLYRTRQRGATFTWQLGLRSKVPPSHWVMAGVALTMEP